MYRTNTTSMTRPDYSDSQSGRNKGNSKHRDLTRRETGHRGQVTALRIPAPSGLSWLCSFCFFLAAQCSSVAAPQPDRYWWQQSAVRIHFVLASSVISAASLSVLLLFQIFWRGICAFWWLFEDWMDRIQMYGRFLFAYLQVQTQMCSAVVAQLNAKFPKSVDQSVIKMKNTLLYIELCFKYAKFYVR